MGIKYCNIFILKMVKIVFLSYNQIIIINLFETKCTKKLINQEAD